MYFRPAGWVVLAGVWLGSCGGPRSGQPHAGLTVAAAANLMDVLGDMGRAFQAKTGVEVVFSYASTTQLATQIENGAPFDLFASADTEHVDSLIAAGKIASDSRAVYALGQLALWIPAGGPAGVHDLRDLAEPRIRFVAIAQPELAPYGRASVDALKSSGLWDTVQPKLVYGTSIGVARQLAASGGATSALTAYSLVLRDKGTVLKIDPHLYKPIQQALGIVAASPNLDAAKQFRSFVLGDAGRAILSNSGYLLP